MPLHLLQDKAEGVVLIWFTLDPTSDDPDDGVLLACGDTRRRACADARVALQRALRDVDALDAKVPR